MVRNTCLKTRRKTKRWAEKRNHVIGFLFTPNHEKSTEESVLFLLLELVVLLSENEQQIERVAGVDFSGWVIVKKAVKTV